MKNKIYFIVGIFFILVIYVCIGQKYNNKITKITNMQKIDENRLVVKYINEYMEMLKCKKFNEAKAHMKNMDIPENFELEKYVTEKLMTSDSLLEVIDIKKNEKNEYETIVRIYPPLYTESSLLNNEQYKEKDVIVLIKLNGLFDYNVNIKEQYNVRI